MGRDDGGLDELQRFHMIAAASGSVATLPASANLRKWEYDLQRSSGSIRPRDALARESPTSRLDCLSQTTVRKEVTRGCDHRSAPRMLPWRAARRINAACRRGTGETGRERGDRTIGGRQRGI